MTLAQTTAASSARICGESPLHCPCNSATLNHMFSIEHEFDATVITLVDEDPAPLQEDVVINSFAECITIEQFDARTNQMMKITLSPEQLRDLAAALDLPEGVYRLRRNTSTS